MMKAMIKSALNQIKTEEKLKNTTHTFLEKSYIKNQQHHDIYLKKGGGFRMKKLVFAACAFVLICGLSIGGYAYYKTPVSYLSLDINPSIELGVNAFGKVVSATSYNMDGSTVLKDQSVSNCTVKDAVQLLVQSAAKNGFINSDGSTVISLTVETNNSGTASSMEENAGQGAQDAIQSAGTAAVVYKTSVALDRRNEACKLGITPGKLNLIQKLQALDPSATVKEYKDAKVTDIMKKIVELKKSAVNNGSQNSDLKDIENTVAQVEKNQEQEKNKQTGQNQEQNRQQETNGTSNGSSSKENSNSTHNSSQNSGSSNSNGSAGSTSVNAGGNGNNYAGSTGQGSTVTTGTQSGQIIAAGQGNGSGGNGGSTSVKGK
jgi:hypothetical protein